MYFHIPVRFLHIIRESGSYSALKRKSRVDYKCAEMEWRNIMEGGGGGGSALVKGFKDLTIPHPLRLSFISNNQAWPQNIPLDGKKHVACPPLTHLQAASLGFSSWSLLSHLCLQKLFLTACHVFKARYLSLFFLGISMRWRATRLMQREP